MSEFEQLLGIIQAAFTFLSLIISFIAIRLSFKARRHLSTSDQIGKLSELFIDPYQNLKFDPPLEIDNENVYSVKVARVHARNAALNPPTAFVKSESLARFHERTLIVSKNWENRFAYELSLALESVGSAAIVGAIPLSFVLVSNADQILLDWIYCYPLVEKLIRSRPDVLLPKKDSLRGKLHRHRLHGEWLAYASAIWLSKNWQAGILSEFLSMFGGLEEISNKEKAIRKNSGLISSRQIASELGKLIYG